MYKLMIADDEMWEREGLELMISRMMPYQFEFIHAENGRKAIQLAEERHPDFIFMDIKMPGVHGLEAIKEINGRLPEVRIVLVTAHEYFGYAKEALSLGVKEYILKPAKRDEIVMILRKMISELDEEKGKRRQEIEVKEKLNQLLPLAENELTLMLLMDSIHDFDCGQLAELFDIRWDQGYALVVSFPLKEKSDWEKLQTKRKEVYEGFKKYVKGQFTCLVSPMIGNRIAIFVPATPQGRGLSHRVQSLRWAEHLQAWLENRFGVTVAIGIGSLQVGMDRLRRSYQEAAATAAGATDNDSICHADDLSLGGDVKVRVTLEEERRLLDALYRQQREETIMQVTQVLNRLLADAGQDVSACRDEITALFISVTRQLVHCPPAEILAHFVAVHDNGALREATMELIERILEEFIRQRERRQVNSVERARLYIEENYQLDITLEHISEFVNLSSYYFSKVFKQYTGETFIDYLTRLRINAAKRLLESDELSFKEICYEVGYNDPSYFSRIFKKTTGVTPTEYRQQASRTTPASQ